ncbi:MAG TPA: polysaccharide deacetylase family protein [Solirubrobacteraceae bacterium]|jgi:peptidoglycan/xylan/chitin deacetylase (PgdA/CDA1 family)|nr:polysaccharide deacetylase family protein [Solirubrobacteraceae bacterium]
MSTYDHRTPASVPGRALADFAMASYVLPGLAQIWPRLRDALGVESRTASGAGYALTFDDGPHPQGTAAVLETLAAAGAHATFFLVGEQLRRNPSLGGEIVAAGHTIGLHCDRHRNLLRMAPRQVRADIDRAQATIEDLTDSSPAIYRPPYGILNASALRLARRRGWRTLLWSGWGRDWERSATPESIASRLTQGASAGSVLLLHDADDYGAPGSWRQTAAALPRVLDTLAARGLQPVPA